MICNNDGIKEGVRLAPFEHTDETVVLHKKHMKLVDEEIKQVKNLLRNIALWFVSTRPPNLVCLSNPTAAMKGDGKKDCEVSRSRCPCYH